MIGWMEKSANKLRGELDELSGVLGIEKDFLQSLLSESDWSFVIKLHAVFEAALVQSLVGHLGEDSLGEVFSYLDTSDKRRGKIAFARALGVLDANECKYLMELSRLRNDLVHKISNVDFSFEKFVQGLDKQQMNNFVSAITLQEPPKKETDAWVEAKRDAGRHPKDVVWFSGISVLALMFMRRKIAISQRELLRMRAETADLQRKSQPISLSELLFGSKPSDEVVKEAPSTRTRGKNDK